MKLSYNKALRIQRAQMVWYRQAIGRVGIRLIKAKTLTCPAHIHPDKPIDVVTINRLVPRGGDFERYLGWNKFKADPDAAAIGWHNAIRRGLV